MNSNPFHFRLIIRARYMLIFSLLIPVILMAQSAQLNVEILDGSTGAPTPVRVHLVNSDGHAAPLPDAAIGVMYGRASYF